MPINASLSEIIDLTTAMALMLVLFNLATIFICDKRIYMKDNEGRMSTTIFTAMDLHLPQHDKLRLVRIGLEFLGAFIAATICASVITGAIRGSPAVAEMGGFATGIYIWIGMVQILRVMRVQQILKIIPTAKYKSVKIDSTMHYIVTVPSLHWFIRERFYSSTILMIVVAVFCAIFC